VRQTVEAVGDGEVLSQVQLAERLRLARGTVSWRVKRALEGGWLVNHESRDGYPHQLALGAPLPEDVPALPLPERVGEVFECSNRSRDEISTIHSSQVAGVDEDNVYELFHAESDSNTRTPLLDVTEEAIMNVENETGVFPSDTDSNTRTRRSNGQVFAPAEVDRLSDAPDENGRRPVLDTHGLWFDEDGRLWDGEEEPLQGSLLWLRGRLAKV
jgi:DNA-binding Lrp family transcriptional regulator